MKQRAPFSSALLPFLAASLIAQSGSSIAKDHPASKDWPTYLGDKARTHYSTLDQINKSNVTNLKVAWTFDTGDKAEFQANPLIINGVLYTATPKRVVLALDAATGKEIWRFDATTVRPGGTNARQRGLVYWESGDDRRIFTGVGPYLYAINARTGKLIPSFGENGSLYLATGVEVPVGSPRPVVLLNTPGTIYKDLYIVGGITSNPGTIRAYDVRSGELKWIFHTIPRPGEYGYHSWPPDAYRKMGAASNWSGTALDEKRGILYVPTETAGPDDFWGGERHGENLFANCLLALDANTGKRLWHFQLTHHDLLDKDLPTPPVLLTVKRNGLTIDAVAQGTKNGVVFVFDRVTGEPLWPIVEHPVPQTDLPGEQTWPTQPVPVKPEPLTRQLYTAGDVSNISTQAKELTTMRYLEVGSYGPYPAPSLKETIIFPGFDGGMEWGGGAADPEGIYYVNVNEIPWLYQMIAMRKPGGERVSLGERMYMINCSACHGLDRKGSANGEFPPLDNLKGNRTPEYVAQFIEQGGGRMPSFANVREGRRRAIVDFLFGVEKSEEAYQKPGSDLDDEIGDPPYIFAGFRRWLDKEGYPAIKPPWGTLNAVDLNTGELKWKVPLGEYPELTAKGIPPTGTENYGGPVVTAGGLIFIGASADETFRAFDKETGKILWQAKLPFSGNATPSTYAVNGKQYVVISAGGGKSNRPAGGSIVAFALPD